MDYPDSEEDGTMTTDGVTMLDDDDTENGEGSTSTPAATGDRECSPKSINHLRGADRSKMPQYRVEFHELRQPVFRQA
jgi:hypothetical protein